ncbi:MAG: hypothetical protein QNI92_17470 [Desulfobacterales bacterium]|nr:hypothetical protein [Desulfobacterales bacterium]
MFKSIRYPAARLNSVGHPGNLKRKRLLVKTNASVAATSKYRRSRFMVTGERIPATHGGA